MFLETLGDKLAIALKELKADIAGKETALSRLICSLSCEMRRGEDAGFVVSSSLPEYPQPLEMSAYSVCSHSIPALSARIDRWAAEL